MAKKTPTFSEDWANKTYTGRAVKAVVDYMKEPAYRPGKGDRLTTNSDATPTNKQGKGDKENMFSAKRLKKGK